MAKGKNFSFPDMTDQTGKALERNIVRRLKDADNEYYNGENSIMSDSEYDILRDALREINPQNPYLKSVGAPPTEKKGGVKCFLPFDLRLGSMNKYKTDKEISAFLKRYNEPYIISHKIDGCSLFVLYNLETNAVGAYTKGDSRECQKVQHILSKDGLRLPAAEYIKKGLSLEKYRYIGVRGEVVLSKKNWEIILNKFKDVESCKDPRNRVSGVLNSKGDDLKSEFYLETVKRLEYICYEVFFFLKDNTLEKQPLYGEQLNILNLMGFHVVNHRGVRSDELTEENLKDLVLKERKTSEYEMDGFVITSSAKRWNRKLGTSSDKDADMDQRGNPKYAFAFKYDPNFYQATVEYISWEIQKDGKIFPTIHVKPFEYANLEGTRRAKISSFNGKSGAMIRDNQIGRGAILKVTRAGDTIPDVLECVVGAPNGADLPTDEDTDGWEWEWDTTNTNIWLKNTGDGKTHPEQTIKALTHFFRVLNVDSFKETTIRKCFSSGMTTVRDYIYATPSLFLAVDGFKTKLAEKVYTSIQKCFDGADLVSFMFALNTFRGLAIKKIQKIFDDMTGLKGKILTAITKNPMTIGESYKDYEAIRTDIENMMGDSITRQSFIDGLWEFFNSVRILAGRLPKAILSNGENGENTEKGAEKDSKWDGQIVVFTGFRDKELEKTIVASGGRVTTSVNGHTTLVISKPAKGGIAETGKVAEARKRGIPVIDYQG